MVIANIHDAKTNLSRLLERVAQGEEVLIARAGKPIANLIPWESSQEPRKPGFLRGQIQIADDFDQLPTESLTAFKSEAE